MSETNDILTVEDLVDLVRDLPESMVRISNPRPSFDSAGQRWWRWGPLLVCVSIDDCGRGGLWLHTSVSCRNGRALPSWSQLAAVKNAIHKDRFVIQVLPPRAQYVNVSEVLHLWERLDAPTIPDTVAERTA